MGYGAEGFSIYDLQLWAQGLGLTVWIFLISSIMGLSIGCLIGLMNCSSSFDISMLKRNSRYYTAKPGRSSTNSALFTPRWSRR
ncbi:MAG: hypothetical protein JKY84_11860 [Emcibacteraceae bacterium]|nr:hypothetical protein [Emcibacteraceae bacterium]